jgi:hypothetical protein
MAAIEGMVTATSREAKIVVYHKDSVSDGDYIYGINMGKEWTGDTSWGIYGKANYGAYFHTKGLWQRKCRFRPEDKSAFEALDADGYVFADPGWLPLHGSTDGRSWLTYVSMSPGSDKWINSTSHVGLGNYSEVNKLSDSWTVDFENNVITNQVDANMSENATEKKAYIGAANKVQNPLSRQRMIKTDMKYECKADNSDIACVTLALADPSNEIDDWNSEGYLQWNGDSAATTITKQGSEHYVISLFAACGSIPHLKINKLTSASVDIDHPGRDNLILSIWKN